MYKQTYTQQDIENIALAFAKQTKTSKEKALQLAQNVAKMAQPVAVYNIPTGRKIGVEAQIIRNKIRELAKECPGRVFAGNELADMFHVTNSSINNNMKALMVEGIVKQAGQAQATGRGRRPLLWQIGCKSL